MASNTYTNRGAKAKNRPSIDPSKVMTICHPLHPMHAGRNPSHYRLGYHLFDQIVRDCLGDVGIIQAPLLIWLPCAFSEVLAPFWIEDGSKIGGGYWRAVEGSKRIEALCEANRQRMAAGGTPLMLDYDADISVKSGDQTESLASIKHIAAQQTRAIESAYTTAFHISTLINRPWGAPEGRNEGSMDEALSRVRYRGKRLSPDMAHGALNPTKGFPNAGPRLIEAMHGGLVWSAALRISAKDHADQDAILDKLESGKDSFIKAGGHPDEFWEQIGGRDVIAVINGTAEPIVFSSGSKSEDETQAAPAPKAQDNPPVSEGDAKVKPVRVKAQKDKSGPKCPPALAKAMKEALDIQIRDLTGKKLTEMRAVLAYVQVLAGETPDESETPACMDEIYACTRAVLA